MKFQVQAHVTYKTRYHIIWIPKRRRPVLVPGVREYFEKVMDTYLFDRYSDVHCLERNVQVDHVHVLLDIPPKYSVSKIVGEIKANTSKEMRKKFAYLKLKEEMWSVGYFVTTVGINEKIIMNYIQNQKKQDKGQAQLAL